MLKLMGNQLFSVVFQVKLLVSLLYLAAFKVCCLGPGNSGICQCANFWISSQLDSFQCLLKVDPTYRPCLESSNYLGLGSGALPVAGSDLALSPVQWSSHVAGCWCISNQNVVANKDGRIGMKNQMQVNVIADHRVLYGVDLAVFLQTLAHIIEDPKDLTL